MKKPAFKEIFAKYWYIIPVMVVMHPLVHWLMNFEGEELVWKDLLKDFLFFAPVFFLLFCGIMYWAALDDWKKSHEQRN